MSFVLKRLIRAKDRILLVKLLCYFITCVPSEVLLQPLHKDSTVFGSVKCSAKPDSCGEETCIMAYVDRICLRSLVRAFAVYKGHKQNLGYLKAENNDQTSTLKLNGLLKEHFWILPRRSPYDTSILWEHMPFLFFVIISNLFI